MRNGSVAAIGVIDALFEQTEMIEVLPHTASVFRLAASLRAEQRLRFIDALHLATALNHRCTFFVTNDTGFKSREHIAVIYLSYRA